MDSATPDPGDSKAQLRAAMRAAMQARLASAELGGASMDDAASAVAIQMAVDRWLARHPSARTIAVFAALPDEVDLSETIARHPERRWLYPRVRGEELDFHHVENPASGLLPGKFGIREPLPGLPLVAVGEIDAFFCPGTAFDARGGRLGRGLGFYDRLLARARPDALKIGIAAPWQIVPDTFPEAHDIAMDEVIGA